MKNKKTNEKHAGTTNPVKYLRETESGDLFIQASPLSEYFFSTDHSFQARFSRPPDPGQGRLEPKRAPNECFSQLLGIRFEAARRPPDPGQSRPEPRSAPNECFLKLLGYVSGRGVGRQILAKAVRSPKVFQMNAFLSFGDTFLGGASAARSGPRPSGAPKCSKLMLF